MELIHTFGDDGSYCSSSERFMDPVSKKPVMINEAVATDKPLPLYDAKTEHPYFNKEKKEWEVRSSDRYDVLLQSQIAAYKDDVILNLLGYRAFIEQSGVELYGKKIPISLPLLIKIQSLLDMSFEPATPISIKIGDKWQELYTNELIVLRAGIRETIYKHDLIQKAHEEKILSLESLEELKAYDVSANWQ